MAALPAREFIVELFNDVLTSVLDDNNYKSKYLFDRNVFQKFIAVMFVNYATTDPMFYGINRGRLCRVGRKGHGQHAAVHRHPQRIDRNRAAFAAGRPGIVPAANPGHGHALVDAPDFGTDTADFGHAGLYAGDAKPDTWSSLSPEHLASRLPVVLVNEEVLLGPIHSLCSAALCVKRQGDAETQRFARVILADACRLVDELKRLNIISPLSNNPGSVIEEVDGRRYEPTVNFADSTLKISKVQ